MAVPVVPGHPQQTPATFAEDPSAVNGGGSPRHNIGTLAAAAQGERALTPAEERWLSRLDAINEFAAHRYVAKAHAFTVEGWASQATELGWSEHALFGVCPNAPWARLDRMGAAWFGPARTVTADTVTTAAGNKLRRDQQAAGAILPWEVVR